MKRVLTFALFACLLAACGRQRVATQPEMPPLAPPSAPPRVVAPPTTDPEPEPKPSEPVHRPARQVPSRTDGRDAKPDTTKREPPKPETPPPPEQAAPPQGILQTGLPATQGEMDKQARTTLAQANQDLKSLKRNTLNADGRTQYDTARRFADQAAQALTQQNYVLALTLANKAATIAAALVGR